MIQHQMLQVGKLIVTRDMPHTPATGLLEITKVENSVVHFSYRRTGEKEALDRYLGKSDCEFMIGHGYWTDAGEAKALPMMTESEIDGLHDEDSLVRHLTHTVTYLTPWLETRDNAQVKAEVHKMLDRHIDDRLKEMKGC